METKVRSIFKTLSWRTAALGIIFSSNNSAFLPPPAPKALLSLIKGPPPGSPRDVIVENSIRVSKIIGSPGYRKTEEQLRAEAIESYERSYYPVGVARQFSAILGSGRVMLVYPGSDWEASRPFAERGRIDFAGRKGFLRVALRHRVPIVPVVSASGVTSRV